MILWSGIDPRFIHRTIGRTLEGKVWIQDSWLRWVESYGTFREDHCVVDAPNEVVFWWELINSWRDHDGNV